MIFLKSPTQAYDIFSAGPAKARPKNLFYVHFTYGSILNADNDIEERASFIVRSSDRPQIQPQATEMNQYNKKRQVYTGYTIQPVRITFYDTSDSVALRLWQKYSSHYFGEFRRTKESARTVHRYDVAEQVYLTDGDRFGFAPQMGTPDDANFFFEDVTVYQVYNGQFVATQLINPKIVSFDPEAMDYSDSEVSTYTISLSPEAVLYHNAAGPQQMNDTLKGAFESFFEGSYFEPQDSDGGGGSASGALLRGRETTPQPSNTVRNPRSPRPDGERIRRELERLTNDPARAAELNLRSAVSPLFAAAVNLVPLPVLNEVARTLANPELWPNGISAAAYDVARGAIEGIGNRSGDYDSGFISDSLVAGAVAGSIANGVSPRDLVSPSGSGRGPYNSSSVPIPPPRPSDINFQVLPPRRPPGVGQDAPPLPPPRPRTPLPPPRPGVGISSEAIAIANSRRSPSAQIGSNETMQIIIGPDGVMRDSQGRPIQQRPPNEAIRDTQGVLGGIADSISPLDRNDYPTLFPPPVMNRPAASAGEEITMQFDEVGEQYSATARQLYGSFLDRLESIERRASPILRSPGRNGE